MRSTCRFACSPTVRHPRIRSGCSGHSPGKASFRSTHPRASRAACSRAPVRWASCRGCRSSTARSATGSSPTAGASSWWRSPRRIGARSTRASSCLTAPRPNIRTRYSSGPTRRAATTTRVRISTSRAAPSGATMVNTAATARRSCNRAAAGSAPTASIRPTPVAPGPGRCRWRPGKTAPGATTWAISRSCRAARARCCRRSSMTARRLVRSRYGASCKACLPCRASEWPLATP
ncbi:hypothetical protein R76727_04562 [Ralstonia mannitolilytica]|nr:hypothetical protein R76727_04562 [Ralstonia mannitolilytica]